MTLYDETLRLLNLHRGRWPKIAASAGLQYSWLTKVADGYIADPGVKKMERLYQQLLLEGEQHDEPGSHAEDF